MYVLAHSQFAVLTATIVILNSRLGFLLSLIHVFFVAFLYNMDKYKPAFFKFIVWLYKDGTPHYKGNDSPCFPTKEYQETELHIDKSKAFSKEFYEKQKTWYCGTEYV